jgi:hypothetical protein
MRRQYLLTREVTETYILGCDDRVPILRHDAKVQCYSIWRVHCSGWVSFADKPCLVDAV